MVIRRFWSIIFGGKALRVSAYDSHGMEHYCLLPDIGNRFERREMREKACEAVERHVKEGRDPGVVDIPLENRMEEWLKA